MHRKLVSIGAAITLLVAAAPASAGYGHGGHHVAGGKDRHGGRGGHGGCGTKACANTIVSLDAAASALGLTSVKLKADLAAGKTLAQEATATGASLTALTTAITTAAQTALTTATTNGTVSAGEAQAVLLGVPQQVVGLLTSTLSGNCGLIKLDVGAAASLFGLTNAQLLASLRGGKTVADLAAATGKTVATLVQGLSAAATGGVTSAAASGAVTQAQAQTLSAAVSQSVTSIATKPLGG
jgi:hypothetical protein